MLLPIGFKFLPLTKGYIYRKLLKHMIVRPHVLLREYKRLKQINPEIGSKMLTGHGPDIVSEGSGLVVGLYMRQPT